MRKSAIAPTLILIVFIGMLVGLRYLMEKQTQPEPEETPKETPKDTLEQAQKQAKKATKQTGRTAVVETSKGAIKFVMYERDAPITTKNFVELAEKKFYDGSNFHRVEPGFVIQGGRSKDPSKEAENIKLELVEGLEHDEGAVAMARADDPNSANSEFYITLAPHHELDRKYAVFGQVIEGMDVVKKIKIGDAIKSVRIIAAPSAGTCTETGCSQKH